MNKQGVAKKEVQDIKKCDRCGCSLIRVKWNVRASYLWKPNTYASQNQLKTKRKCEP